MGGGIAINLVQKGGYTVYGYDLAQPLLDKFVAAGGKAASTPKEAASQADIMISMVANAAQNTSLLFEGPDCVVKGLGKGKTFMLCSTTAPSFVSEVRKRLYEEFGRPDIKLLDCPVSGGTLRAADGSLSIFASGPDADVEAAKDVLDCMSGNLYRMGALTNGMKTKTIHQLLAATNIIAAAEAMGLAATVGINTQAVYEHVNGSDAGSFMFANRVPHMLQNDWHPYSALAIILKDTGIVTDAARALQFPTPLAATAEQLYLQGVQAGLLRDDDAKLVQIYLPHGKGDLVAAKAEADVRMRASFQVSKDTIVDLLAGIHLAAAVEAMAFCKALGMDRRILSDIVAQAAGKSEMFVKCIPGMLEADRWSLADCAQATDVGQKLADAIDKCRQIKYPCPMAAVALQQFHFATLSGVTITDAGRDGRDAR